MTAALVQGSFAPSLAMIEALSRLIESDPRSLAMGRTLEECDRDEAVARRLGELLATVDDDPRAASLRDRIEAARSWHAALSEHLQQRRRFVTLAHQHAPAMGTSPDKLLDNPVCEWVAAIPEDEIARSKREADILRAAFKGDGKAEIDAYRNGTHALHRTRNRPQPAISSRARSSASKGKT